MPQYIRITNCGGALREFWELIGATNKDKNDPTKIGFKGSGGKFSIPAAIRLGIEIIITSADDVGPYTINYITKRTPGGFDKILVSYDGGSHAVSTGLVTAALDDWDRPIRGDGRACYKVLREFIVNAYDADKSFTMEWVDNIAPPKPGKTSVYLSYIKDIEDLFGAIARYFKIFDGTIPEYSTQNINGEKILFYPRSDPNPNFTRLFVCGVLAHCYIGASAFDYSFGVKDVLSEERTIKDWHHLIGLLYQSISAVSDVNIARRLLPFILAPSLESEAIRAMQKDGTIIWNDKMQKAWQKAWKEEIGNNCILGGFAPEVDLECNSFGFGVIDPRSPEVRKFLSQRGIRTTNGAYADVTARIAVSREELSDRARKNFDKALLIFRENYPTKVKIPKFSFFKQKKISVEGIALSNEPGKEEVGINTCVLEDGVREILATLVHEYRHITISMKDYDRAFINSADGPLADLLLEKHEMKKKIAEMQRRKN